MPKHNQWNPEAKADMLAMLELGIHPLQRLQHSLFQKDNICDLCTLELPSRRGLEVHRRHCERKHYGAVASANAR